MLLDMQHFQEISDKANSILKLGDGNNVRLTHQHGGATALVYRSELILQRHSAYLMKSCRREIKYSLSILG